MRDAIGHVNTRVRTSTWIMFNKSPTRTRWFGFSSGRPRHFLVDHLRIYDRSDLRARYLCSCRAVAVSYADSARADETRSRQFDSALSTVNSRKSTLPDCNWIVTHRVRPLITSRRSPNYHAHRSRLSRDACHASDCYCY